MINRNLPEQEADKGKVSENEAARTEVADKTFSRAIGNQAMQRWATPRLAAPGMMVQRQAADENDATAAPAPITRPPLIVPDTATDLQPGQMRRSDFLAQLKTAVCQTADEALKGTIYAAVGCPYIERWFAYYSGQDSQHIERAIQRFAPGAAQATTAQAIIPAITKRVQQGIATWVETGRVTGVPEGITAELPVSQPTDLPPTSDSVQFKTEAGVDAAATNPAAIKAGLGHGRSLDSTSYSRLGSAFGSDFSQVRIHTGSAAGRMAQQLRARAFTIGQDIAFAPGEYQPGSPIGDALLAHELAHVVQQENAPETSGPIGPESQTLEEDADWSAVRAIASLWQGAKGKLADISRKALPRLRSGLRLQRCQVAVPVGVGATWFFAGEKTANAPGFDPVTGEQEPTIANPTVGEYLAEATTGTVLIVISGPVSGGARGWLTRRLFAGSTGWAARTLPAVPTGALSFGSLDMAFQTVTGDAPWEPTYNWRRTGLMAGLGATAMPFTAASGYFILPAEGVSSASGLQLMTYYGSNVIGHGALGSGMMQIADPERTMSDVPGDFVLFGLGGGLAAHGEGALMEHLYPGGKVPFRTSITDPEAFILRDAEGALGEVNTIYLVQKNENILVAQRIGTFTPEVEYLGAYDPTPNISLEGSLAAKSSAAVPIYDLSPEGGLMLRPYQELEVGAGEVRLTVRESVKAPGEEAPVIEASKEPHAILPSGESVPPDSYMGGYHGTGEIAPEAAFKNGLPGRGSDWRLLEHSEARSQSAFRGTTQMISDPVAEQGAAYWADEGGWVYEIRGVPTWNVNKLLEGRVQTPGGFRGNLMHGEVEHAVPSRIPPENIKRAGQVTRSATGKLMVREWEVNPNFKGE